MEPTDRHRAMVAEHADRVASAYHGARARGARPDRLVLFLAPETLPDLAAVLADLGARGARASAGVVVVAVDSRAARDRFGWDDGPLAAPAPRVLVQLGWGSDDVACWRAPELERRGAC